MISEGVPLAYMWVHFLLQEAVLAQSFKSVFLTEPCITFLHSFPNITDDTRHLLVLAGLAYTDAIGSLDKQ